MFNYEKQRYECDRCGCWISSNKHIQLCDECEKYVDDYVKQKRSEHNEYRGTEKSEQQVQ